LLALKLVINGLGDLVIELLLELVRYAIYVVLGDYLLADKQDALPGRIARLRPCLAARRSGFDGNG
jgi:hypothetical protein